MNNAKKAILIIMLLEDFINLMSEHEPSRTKEEQDETIDALIIVGLDIQWVMDTSGIFVVKELARLLAELDFTIEDIDKEMGLDG